VKAGRVCSSFDLLHIQVTCTATYERLGCKRFIGALLCQTNCSHLGLVLRVELMVLNTCEPGYLESRVVGAFTQHQIASRGPSKTTSDMCAHLCS
jgi:hypothetical protein